MLPLKVPGVQHVRGTMKTPVKWQSKASTSASRGCLSSAALMWWALFAAWCGGAVRLVGPSRLCLLVCWAWQSLWWSQDKQKGYHLLSARPNSSFIYKQRGRGRRHKKKYVSLQPSSERGGTDHLIISVAGYILKILHNYKLTMSSNWTDTSGTTLALLINGSVVNIITFPDTVLMYTHEY